MKKIANTIISVQKSKNINQIKQLKKLKGTSNVYRIRVGEFRLGLIIDGFIVEFIRCLQRKNIYKYFPK